MRLVTDVNVIFSALINKGNAFKVFEANKLFKKFEFIAPEFLFKEIGVRMDKLILQTKLSNEELANTFKFLKEEIDFIPASEFMDKLAEALEINKKDAPYIALALKTNVAIFSGDEGLRKQNKVKIFSPRELLDMLGME